MINFYSRDLKFHEFFGTKFLSHVEQKLSTAFQCGAKKCGAPRWNFRFKSNLIALRQIGHKGYFTSILTAKSINGPQPVWSNQIIREFIVSTRGKIHSRILVFSLICSFKSYTPDNFIVKDIPCSTEVEQPCY